MAKPYYQSDGKEGDLVKVAPEGVGKHEFFPEKDKKPLFLEFNMRGKKFP